VLAQSLPCRGQTEETRSPILSIDPPIDETLCLQLIYELAGTRPIDAQARRQSILIDIGLLEQIRQHAILQRRQVGDRRHFSDGSHAYLGETARQRRHHTLDRSAAFQRDQIVPAPSRRLLHW
jgi:hypothetical protein